MASVTDQQAFFSQLCSSPQIGLSLDRLNMGVGADFLDSMAEPMATAFASMRDLEAGAVANPDEKRMVGHYWLRAPESAPQAELTDEITQTLDRIRQFAADVHAGKIKPSKGELFTDLLVIGIGGSALGPQFVADALGDPVTDAMRVHFIDNTDSDGMSRTFARIGSRIGSTLAIVISKSGGTPETRNGMLFAQKRFRDAGLKFADHAVAVTSAGSKLDQTAESDGWIDRFPMWDWVGGRTSQTSAVGLLPAALQGIDIDAMLSGAAGCDQVTRDGDVDANPAAQLALMWYHATGGKGQKDMVVLPYKDRLLLLSRYLQQLIMESLGKSLDLDGKVVEQGITVYGNKGSTDQHAYVQQLRDGVRNFFVTFIEVLETGAGDGVEVEPGITPCDYLRGFQLGTAQALTEAGRPNMTLTIQRVDAYHVGVLIALFERAVGLYASLVNINAYHQPGVEAGKKAAAAILDLQGRLAKQLDSASDSMTAAELADLLDGADLPTVFKLLEGLAANGRVKRTDGDSPAAHRYSAD